MDIKHVHKKKHGLFLIFYNDARYIEEFLASGYKSFFDLVASCALDHHSLRAQIKIDKPLST
jgi:hypothetical protein